MSDVRSRLQARKAMLQGLFDIYRLEAPVLFSEHVEGDEQALFAHAAKLNCMGIAV